MIGLIRLSYGGEAKSVIALPSLGLLGILRPKMTGEVPLLLYTRKVPLLLPFIKELGRLMVRHPLK